jgi:hypothetical protein
MTGFLARSTAAREVFRDRSIGRKAFDPVSGAFGAVA